MKREFRVLKHGKVRASSDGKGITGYAAVFNQRADLGWMLEVVMPGAFTDCLATDPDVRALFNHNPDIVLGRTKSGTLRLKEDNRGLQFDVDLPDTQAGRDVRASIARGDVDQCSFGFTVDEQTWREEKNDAGEMETTRELVAVTVYDISPVVFPAYEGTSVSERTLWPDGVPESIAIAKDSVHYKAEMRAILADRLARMGAGDRARRGSVWGA